MAKKKKKNYYDISDDDPYAILTKNIQQKGADNVVSEQISRKNRIDEEKRIETQKVASTLPTWKTQGMSSLLKPKKSTGFNPSSMLQMGNDIITGRYKSTLPDSRSTMEKVGDFAGGFLKAPLEKGNINERKSRIANKSLDFVLPKSSRTSPFKTIVQPDTLQSKMKKTTADFVLPLTESIVTPTLNTLNAFGNAPRNAIVKDILGKTPQGYTQEEAKKKGIKPIYANSGNAFYPYKTINTRAENNAVTGLIKGLNPNAGKEDTYSTLDVMMGANKNKAEKFKERNPITANILDFGGAVIGDPLTYVGSPIFKGIKNGIAQIAKRSPALMPNLSKKAAEYLAREATKKVAQNALETGGTIGSKGLFKKQLITEGTIYDDFARQVKEAIPNITAGQLENIIKTQAPRSLADEFIRGTQKGTQATAKQATQFADDALKNPVNFERNQAQQAIDKVKFDMPGAYLPKPAGNQPFPTREEWNKQYGLGEGARSKPENIMNVVRDIGKNVMENKGVNNVDEALNYYLKEFDIKAPVGIKNGLRSAKKVADTEKYTNKITGQLRYDINFRKDLTLEERIGALRHEVEHIKDLERGYDIKVLQNTGEQNIQHHKDYGHFEGDYLYNKQKQAYEETLKKAIQEKGRKPILKEALGQPQQKTLGSVKPVTSQVTGDFIPNNMRQVQRNRPSLKTINEPSIVREMPKNNYTPEQNKALTELDNKYRNRINAQKKYPNSDPMTQNKILKGMGMEQSAKRREIIQGDKLIPIDGGLTAKELSSKINKLKTNYKGKEVMTPAGEAIATGNNTFGVVEVKLPDGTIKNYAKDKITPKIDIDAEIAKQRQALSQTIEQPKPIQQPMQRITQPKPIQHQTTTKLPTAKQPQPKQTLPVAKQSTPKQPKQATLPPVKNKQPSMKVTDPQNTFKPLSRAQIEILGQDVETSMSKNASKYKDIDQGILKELDESPITYQKAQGGYLKEINKVAQQRFDEGYETALDKYLKADKGTFDPADIPLAGMLANEAGKRGDVKLAREILAHAADKAVEAGRMSVAHKLLRDVRDPGTFVTYMEKQVERINRQGEKTFGEKWKPVKLEDADIKEVYSLELFDEKVFKATSEKFYDKINEQIPSTFLDKLDAWRRMAMLLNPKTHARNIIGNTLMVPLRKSSDVLAASMEKVIIRDASKRTKSVGWSLDEELRKVVKNDWLANKDDFITGGRYDIENLKVGSQEAPVFKNKVLERINQFSKDALNAGDVPFLRRAYEDALGGFMKARKLKVVTEEARQYALRRAQEATYRQSNWFSNSISSLKKQGGIKRVVAEAAIPFAKTPSNILMRAVEYSPAGLFKAMYSKAKGKEAAMVIEDLAKGMTGTGIVGLGMMLADMGFLQGERPKSQKVSSLNQVEGEQPYSIDTPLGTYTFDWASPISIPLAAGVALYGGIKKKYADGNDVDKFINTFIDSVSGSGETAINMSMIKSIKDLFSNNGTITEKALGLFGNYASQFIPTVSAQTARTIDTTQRSTYDTNPLSQFKNSVQAKIPGLSQQLEPKVDIFGRDMKNGNAFDQFLSPGRWMSKDNDPVSKELSRLYEKYPDSSTMIPGLAPKVISDPSGKKITLTPKEITQFQRTMGKANYTMLKNLMNNSDYKNTNDSLKPKALEKIVRDNREKAKDELLKKHGYVKPSKGETRYLNRIKRNQSKQISRLIDTLGND